MAEPNDGGTQRSDRRADTKPCGCAERESAPDAAASKGEECGCAGATPPQVRPSAAVPGLTPEVLARVLAPWAALTKAPGTTVHHSPGSEDRERMRWIPRIDNIFPGREEGVVVGPCSYWAPGDGSLVPMGPVRR